MLRIEQSIAAARRDRVLGELAERAAASIGRPPAPPKVTAEAVGAWLAAAVASVFLVAVLVLVVVHLGDVWAWTGHHPIRTAIGVAAPLGLVGAWLSSTRFDPPKETP